jgi:transcriptional regulator with XRE-family HTH domain
MSVVALSLGTIGAVVIAQGKQAARGKGGPTPQGRPLLSLGTLIKGLRQSKHLTQRQLAHKCGVSPAYVSLIECEERYPGEDLCVKLATVLDYDARELAARARLVKSPDTAKRLYGPGTSDGGRDWNGTNPGGRGGDYDPDLEALRRRLENLRDFMPAESYTKLLTSMLKILEVYETTGSAPSHKGG